MSLLADDQTRSAVRELVVSVQPHDPQEAADQAWILAWIDSGAQLWRVEKPATPPHHLVVYTILFDEPTRSIMIVYHLLAQAWLFPGGHSDDLENPRSTAWRELAEELQIQPPFHPVRGDDPIFLTVTQTRGPGTHTDVTMWFLFLADRDEAVVPDLGEFREVRWVPLDDRASWPEGVFDPALERFLDKLTILLDPEASMRGASHRGLRQPGRPG
ncbi:NUDIX domain-containing protein (plasmid) [Streptosporangium sp. NBC_01495]|uniref:NUDIX domain-containing protein n=1 Tax=Streptosporangium sp. NBC_01495 TaxID=2903899 RepID=UPI002E32781F|nr:NUDIX domain-containing protein [Streptosporangium sp. NBC_01495]